VATLTIILLVAFDCVVVVRNAIVNMFVSQGCLLFLETCVHFLEIRQRTLKTQQKLCTDTRTYFLFCMVNY